MKIRTKIPIGIKPIDIDSVLYLEDDNGSGILTLDFDDNGKICGIILYTKIDDRREKWCYINPVTQVVEKRFEQIMHGRHLEIVEYDSSGNVIRRENEPQI